MLLIAPVAIILVAENLGHIKAVTAMTGKTSTAAWAGLYRRWYRHHYGGGSAGGTGDHLCRNIGVMAATKIYSTAVFLVAGCMAILLGFSPNSAR